MRRYGGTQPQAVFEKSKLLAVSQMVQTLELLQVRQPAISNPQFVQVPEGLGAWVFEEHSVHVAVSEHSVQPVSVVAQV